MGVGSDAAGGGELACTGCTGHRPNSACCRRVRGTCAYSGGVELPDRWHSQAAGEESSDIQALLCASVLYLYFTRASCEHEISIFANSGGLHIIIARERSQCFGANLRRAGKREGGRSHPEAQGVDTVEVGEHGPTLGLDTEVVLGSIRHQDAVT